MCDVRLESCDARFDGPLRRCGSCSQFYVLDLC
jgi:hypothetical protein